MASPNVFPAALATAGPDIALYAAQYLSGSILWVDSTSTAASDANAGTEPELPKATWTSAYSVASAGDLIVVGASHVETISVANVLGTANVATIGLGLGSTRPRFTSAVAGAMWTANVAGLEFRNLYFPASTAATTARISIAAGGTDCTVANCYFEAGTNDGTSCVTVTGARARLRSCDFVVTASRPARGILVNGAVASCAFEDILLDGGAYGWASPAFGVTAAATLMQLQNIRLANRSDLVITQTGTSYRMFGVRAIDNKGSRVVIAA